MHETTGGSDTREPRALDAPELTFTLADELARLRDEPGYADFGRSSKTLARSGPLRVVLTAARSGVRVGAETAEGPLAIQVLEGRVTGGRAGEAADAGGTIGAGGLAWFGAGGPWGVRVDEDAALLLTVAGDDHEAIDGAASAAGGGADAADGGAELPAQGI